MRKQQWLHLILISFLVLTACQSTSAATSAPAAENTSPPQVESATTVPTVETQSGLSGSIAIFEALDSERGQEAANWARLAVDDFNAASGANITLVEAETGNSPTTALAAAGDLAGTRDLLAVIGPGLASQALASVPTLDTAGLPVVTWSGLAALTQQSHRGLFRLAPVDDGQGAAAGRFIVAELKASKVILVSLSSQNGVYYQTLNTSFEQAVAAGGAAIVDRQELTETTDPAGLASQIQTSGADAVFMAVGSLEQVRELSNALQGTVTVVAHYYAASSALLDAEGVYVLSRLPTLPSDLETRYQDRHGDYQLDESLAYFATMTALEAIQRAAESGSMDRQAVRDTLMQTNGLFGSPGMPVAFEANGDLKGAQFYVLQVENAGFKTVWP